MNITPKNTGIKINIVGYSANVYNDIMYNQSYLMCTFRNIEQNGIFGLNIYELILEDLSHLSQGYGFSPISALMCFFGDPAKENYFSHW